MPVIGFLGSASPGPLAPFVAAFRQGLSETGYVEGQNVAIEYRWAEGQYDRLPALAADFVGRKVDVIVARAAAFRHWRQKTRPRRSRSSFSPAATRSRHGLVASLARPGGNLTGMTLFAVELMRQAGRANAELVPEARVLALLVNPNVQLPRAYTRCAGSGAREAAAAPYPEGSHRKRDRCRFCLPCRAA